MSELNELLSAIKARANNEANDFIDVCKISAIDGQALYNIARQDMPALIEAFQYFIRVVRDSGDEGDTNVWDKECEQVVRILQNSQGGEG